MFSETASEKLGHPVLDSNFVSESNSSVSQAAQTKVPSSFWSSRSPVNLGSVPCSRRISYSSSVSTSRHSSSVSGRSSALADGFDIPKQGDGRFCVLGRAHPRGSKNGRHTHNVGGPVGTRSTGNTADSDRKVGVGVDDTVGVFGHPPVGDEFEKLDQYSRS